jgi:outer membrane protein OmpA-like peptidoglycan-associated protein
MADFETRPTGSGKEIALLVGVLLLVAAATIATYWMRTQGAEASGPESAAPRTRATAPAPTATDDGVTHADIYFDFKSTRLRAEAARLLQDRAALMDRSSAWGVLVQGHADRHGPAEYNRRLAQQRAEAVRQFLVELGVPEASVKVVTIGQEGALCDDPSRECQQLNRRVHLEIRRLGPLSAGEPVRPTMTSGDVLQTIGHDAARP